MASVNVSQFVAQNSVILPVFAPVIHSGPVVTTGTTPGTGVLTTANAYPQPINNQDWQLILTGEALVNTTSFASSSTEVLLLPSGPGSSGPGLPGGMCIDSYPALQYAINTFSVPVPVPAANFSAAVPVFQVEQFAAVTAQAINVGNGSNAGFSINSWQPNPYATVQFTPKTGPVLSFSHVFTGILVNITILTAAHGTARISFQVTLAGKIVFTNSGIVPIP